MVKKKLLQIVSLVLSLVLINSMTVFAEKEVHLHNDSFQNVYDVDELLTLLNAGIIQPNNTTRTISSSFSEVNELYTIISPSNWPWTDCSNVLGHSWGEWGGWREITERRMHRKSDTHCLAILQRSRSCTRTHCSKHESEQMSAYVFCPC
ncbi:MAG: hypothetical protein FWE14_12710 [Lachnospiraceae bacterium]|nr:hypothetical protein [Lachnospiraceae bacterium]